MHRTGLLQALAHYQTQYASEAALIERFTRFVQTYPDCFERSLAVGHITGSAWLVNEPGTHVLLTHHRKLNMWVQLGGHADGDTDVQRVAGNEAREESGLRQIEPLSHTIFDIDIHAIPARGTDPAHLHYDVRFAFRVIGSDPFIVSDESHALAWCAIEQIPQLTPEASMHRMAQKWFQQYGSVAQA
jgi:ADP-ribose pyrophosphatase YjhB (NUDIX family)